MSPNFDLNLKFKDNRHVSPEKRPGTEKAYTSEESPMSNSDSVPRADTRRKRGNAREIETVGGHRGTAADL